MTSKHIRTAQIRILFDLNIKKIQYNWTTYKALIASNITKPNPFANLQGSGKRSLHHIYN